MRKTGGKRAPLMKRMEKQGSSRIRPEGNESRLHFGAAFFRRMKQKQSARSARTLCFFL